MSYVKKSFIVGAFFCLCSQAGLANDGQVVDTVPLPPPAVLSGEPLEPEITIRDGDRETVYEYRIDGKLIMIKVQPEGDVAPYYFVDNDGDGELEYTADDPTGGVPVNQWVLFRW
jgi:hypothetical protein